MDGIITAGIDIGSTMSKVVLLGDDGVLCGMLRETTAEHRQLAGDLLEDACREAGVKRTDIAFTVGTGYGRVNVPFADKQITEITCHARAIAALHPTARTVIEIGGQDSKAISLTAEGRVQDFVMNDKCAAGTGRFIQLVARTLEMRLDEMNEAALAAERAVSMHHYCAVLAQQEIVNEMSRGVPAECILAGLFESFADRILRMAAPIGICPAIVLTGGGAKHHALRAALEKRLCCDVLTPEEPFLTGAYGAAWLAREAYRKRCEKQS